MADNRPAAEQLSDQLQQALVARLREVSNISDGPEGTVFSGNLPGVRIVTARDIAEVFSGTYDVDYAHTFEAETPATGYVDLVCLHCGETIPDVAVALGAVTTTDKPGVSKVRLKATANVRTHTCGQQTLPQPQPPEVEGQVGMDEVGSDFDADPDDDDDEEDEDAEAEAIERLEQAPAVADDTLDDGDLLPGEAEAVAEQPKKKGRALN